MKIFLRNVKIKLKPWGREIWFAWTEKYAGKILEIKKGRRFSLQYHEKKCETQCGVKGKVKFTLGVPGTAHGGTGGKRAPENAKLRHKILKKGQKIDIPPRTVHRALALTNAVIFEVSTPELDDVVKLADDYGRTGRGNNEKLDRKLSKKPLKN